MNDEKDLTHIISLLFRKGRIPENKVPSNHIRNFLLDLE
jgi:hypothetical protein